jgi:hypothetical protein
MANTDVMITQQGGEYIPSVCEVPIVLGDTVTFYADPTYQTNLCMNGDTVAILSPQPDVPVMIAAGDSAQFAFASAATGSYGVLVGGADLDCPGGITFGFPASAVLNIFAGLVPVGSGPAGDPRT